MACARTPGTYTRPVLTEGRGGTFVEMEAGSDPKSFGSRMQMAIVGRRLLRHWIEHVLEKLRRAAEK